MKMPIIRVWEFQGIGLIISHPSGVLYSNQTGGYHCLQPENEGVFVPLTNPAVDQQIQLEKHFTGSKWKGYCSNGIDEETADFLDTVFASSYLTEYLKVNREKLTESHQAWINVIILPQEREADLQEFYGFTSQQGIITWQNSD